MESFWDKMHSGIVQKVVNSKHFQLICDNSLKHSLKLADRLTEISWNEQYFLLILDRKTK